MNIWEELEKINIENLRSALEDVSKTDDTLTEMATVRGNKIPTSVDDIDFSFYFSNKHNVPHGIRLKVVWNRDRFGKSADGWIELHGSYRYYISNDKNAYKPKSWEIRGLQYFARKYKVLFAAVWECKLDEDDVADWFKGYISFTKLIASFVDISEENYYNLNHCKSIRELEDCVRKYNIFNMND